MCKRSTPFSGNERSASTPVTCMRSGTNVASGNSRRSGCHVSQLDAEGGQHRVTLNDARRIIAAAEQRAAEIGQSMNIAVADEGGNLVAHVRMDGAWIGSIYIAMKKAYTSRAFDIATKDLAPHCQSGGQFFGIHAS